MALKCVGMRMEGRKDERRREREGGRAAAEDAGR